MSSNNILSVLFAAQQPSPSRPTTSGRSSAGKPKLTHSSSVSEAYASPSAGPATPKSRSGKRVPRRQTSTTPFNATSPMTSTPFGYRKAGSASPHQGTGSTSPFAGSKFSDSPAARAIPLPPMGWFTDAVDLGNTSSSDTESLASELSAMSVDAPVFGGVRINPLQLIAAASSA